MCPMSWRGPNLRSLPWHFWLGIAVEMVAATGMAVIHDEGNPFFLVCLVFFLCGFGLCGLGVKDAKRREEQ